MGLALENVVDDNQAAYPVLDRPPGLSYGYAPKELWWITVFSWRFIGLRN